jgi:ribosomal protein L7Ae-like RNA K-turn-binding protein
MEKTNIKVLSLLGFAQKAGKLISGINTVESLIGNSQIKLLIIAGDAQPKFLKQMKDKCDNLGQKHLIFGTKDELGQAIGKSARTIIAIKDINIAGAILEYIKTSGRL